MKAFSKLSSNHSHTEGVTISFRNGIFETDKPQEIAILKKYDGYYWNIQKEPPERTKIKLEGNDTTEKEKVVSTPQYEGETANKLETLSRGELYKLAKEKGFKGKYVGATKEGLIKFLEK